MARVCSVTGKRPLKGRRIIHKGQSKKSGGIGLQLVKQTTRTFKPNVQRIRVRTANGSVKRINTTDDKCTFVQEDAMFLSYTDPSRNISVGDARSELAQSLRNRYRDGDGNNDDNDDVALDLIVAITDGDVDSDVCHRQAIYFLKKNDYHSSLKCIEKARMAYLKTSELGEIDHEPKFMSIVSTQAVCLLKLGDFMTAKTFAEQVGLGSPL